MPPDGGFDGTLGFPGEGPPAIIAAPWFLAAVTTRELIESKRRKLDGVAATPVPTDRKLDFGPTASRPPRGTARAIPGLADTALGRLQPGDLCLILIDQVEEALEHIARRVAE